LLLVSRLDFIIFDETNFPLQGGFAHGSLGQFKLDAGDGRGADAQTYDALCAIRIGAAQ
jgi:hypothetical protein